MDANEVISYPLMTESASLMVERDNKLIFIVNLKAGKSDIKKAVEELYEVKVLKVNLLITPQGVKKAFVKLTPEFKASDVAIKLRNTIKLFRRHDLWENEFVFKDVVAVAKTGALPLTNVLLQQNIQ